ncbi:MAG: DUF3592 domain-containing protein [Bacteroidales bacterium]|jgi:hypothetical protein
MRTTMNKIDLNDDKNNKKIALILLIISIVLIIGTVFDYSYKLKNYSFNKTMGKVTRFEKKITYKGNRYLDFEYQYVVAGILYKNNTVGYGVGDANAYEAAFENSNEIIVYYNRENPQESVLVKGVSFVYLIPLLFSLIILIFSLVAYFSSKSERVRKIWEEMAG